jgi:hypothetical protein
MTEADLLLLLAAAFAGTLLLVWLIEGVKFYRTYHGKRIITCPETRRPAAVEVAAARGAFSTLVAPELRLRDCSRWPEKKDCGQFCLSQIEAAPEDCLVTSIINRWYLGKHCVYCSRPFLRLEWNEHRPALRDAAGATVQWNEVPAEKLPEVLATHAPVCWHCHVAESFRHQHPELVTDRPVH